MFKIVEQFLPTQLNEKEITIIIEKVIEKLNASSIADMGNVIKNVITVHKTFDCGFN